MFGDQVKTRSTILFRNSLEQETRSPFAVAVPLCEVFCLGVIAQRLNRGFAFDPATKHVVGDAEAEALLKGSPNTPRTGWEGFYKV